MSVDWRRQRVQRSHPTLSLSRQCVLLGISRGSLYYQPKGPSEQDLALMRLIDAQYLKAPWYGARQMRRVLEREGHEVGRRRVRRLMRTMGLRSVAPGPNTSRRCPAHPVYPYLLRDLPITRANQVWCADITFVPMAHGFVYLVAIMDWHTRHVLSWRLSTPAATSTSPMCGRVKVPQLRRRDGFDGYTRSARLATRAAASLRRQLLPSNLSKCA